MAMIIILIFSSIIIYFINTIIAKKNYLPNFTGEMHQKFTFYKNIQLSGGIYIFLYLLVIKLNEFDKLFLIFLFGIFLVGFLSDLRKLNSVNQRLLAQFFIVVFSVIYFELSIFPTRIFILDNILQNNYLNYFFLSVCILIVLNGSNFIDGLNTLNIGYYFLILLTLKILSLDNNLIFQDSTELLLFSFLIIFLFNLFNKFYIGDSGSYLNGFFFSYFLISFYQNNNLISPFFIALLLWYPSFEILISIIRKTSISLSPFKPDKNHFHQLLFYFIKKKNSNKNLISNVISANLINVYNFAVFFIGSKNVYNSELQIVLIILSIIIYCFFYFKLLNFRKLNS